MISPLDVPMGYSDEQVMQPISSSVGSFADLTSSQFGAVPNLPSAAQKGSVSRSCASGTYSSSNDQLLSRGYGGSSLQQSKSPFDGSPSSTSCSPSLTPPALELLKPGMRDVPAWLKSLRLHKYTAMFAELSYEEMMNLDETKLERRNVTKGARTKILQSIQKLYSRAADLRTMHEKLSISHPQRCLRCAIATLRQMIATPMIPYTPMPGESSECVDGFVTISYIKDQNIPGLIFNLLGEIQKAVFVSGRQPMDIEYEYLLMLFSVFDKLINNEAFTAMQKQRVLQWKRLARKAIRPADVRRQRIGMPHSGKCEICHYKDMANRDGGKANLRSDGGQTDKAPYRVQQRNASRVGNQQHHCSTQDWAHLARNTSQASSSPLGLQQQPRQNVLNAGYWPQIFSMETTSNIQRSRPRQMAPLSAHAFTQNLPQYRSQGYPAGNRPLSAIPLLSGSSQSCEGLSRWPRSIYENSELLPRESTCCARFHGSHPLNSSASLWDSLAAAAWPIERSGESTSGYCSSTSERSSGAGSPRACNAGQTLYDRVCRDVAALQLSI